VVGQPGKVIRELHAEAAAKLTASAESYQRNWKKFAKGLEVQS
jgi:carbonic anhydrase/acetyltransferase-like protein (isoleucine patch superfamily)